MIKGMEMAKNTETVQLGVSLNVRACVGETIKEIDSMYIRACLRQENKIERVSVRDRKTDKWRGRKRKNS